MRITDPDAGDDDNVPMTPLIDMVFLLLIFFFAATTFARDERDSDVRLAQSSNIQPLTAGPAQQLVINIRRDGTLIVARNSVDLNGLVAQLSQAVAANRQQDVLVRADGEVPFRCFAAVVDACHRAGVQHHRIATLHEGNP